MLSLLLCDLGGGSSPISCVTTAVEESSGRGSHTGSQVPQLVSKAITVPTAHWPEQVTWPSVTGGQEVQPCVLRSGDTTQDFRDSRRGVPGKCLQRHRCDRGPSEPAVREVWGLSHESVPLIRESGESRLSGEQPGL